MSNDAWQHDHAAAAADDDDGNDEYVAYVYYTMIYQHAKQCCILTNRCSV
jgi:hypothetical protein